jgi:hypothetical protein
MRQTNPKYQIIQTSESAGFEFFSFWPFEIVSNFGFRASNFDLILGDLGALSAINIRESRWKGIRT